jgi:hypothetical protein
LRVAWRRGIEKSLKEKPTEVTPYKLLPDAHHNAAAVVKSLREVVFLDSAVVIQCGRMNRGLEVLGS